MTSLKTFLNAKDARDLMEQIDSSGSKHLFDPYCNCPDCIQVMDDHYCKLYYQERKQLRSEFECEDSDDQ
jgi:hypothetical protein